MPHAHSHDHGHHHGHAHGSHSHGPATPHPAQAAPWSILRMTVLSRLSAAVAVSAAPWTGVWLATRGAWPRQCNFATSRWGMTRIRRGIPSMAGAPKARWWGGAAPTSAGRAPL